MKKNLLSIVLIILAFLAAPVWAQGPHRAGLVVQFPDGQIETLCVEFAETEITGAHLLDRSGLTVIQDYSSGLGAKVCKIEETGCDYPGENCWCQCQGSPCAYWNYWQWKDSRWVYSPVGASDRRLSDGDIDGWIWGDGHNPPPQVSLDEICQAAVETPKATALPFVSPLDTPAAQPAITPSPLPTATTSASPLVQPTAVTRPAASPTATTAARVYVPNISGESTVSKNPEATPPPPPDRYTGLAGVLAAMGLIVLTVWRRRKGV